MTSRSLFKTYWASSGEVEDPDLDTAHPSYKPNRYLSIGWTVEKPPESWQNFLQQITDLKIIERLENGINIWDSSVTYHLSSVALHKGLFYVAIKGPNSNVEPGTDATVWNSVLSVSGPQYLQALADLNGTYTGHMQKKNPHNDQIGNLIGGGYTKAQFDKVEDPNNPITFSYHKAKTGRAHMESAEQIGVLKRVSGGNYLDVVGFKNGIWIGAVGNSIDSPAPTLFTLSNGTGNILLLNNGIPSVYFANKNIVSPITTEATAPTIQMKLNNSFALPPPFLLLSFKGSLSCVGVGAARIEGPTTFDARFGLSTGNDSSKAPSVGVFKCAVACTVVMSTYSGVTGAKTTIRKDYANLDFSNPMNLVTLAHDIGVAPGFEFISDLRVYPQLTELQKSHLER